LNLYAESSAVIAWLLGESTATTVGRLLGESDLIFASDLTLVECDRVLIRGVSAGVFREAEAADRRARLAAAAAHWYLMRLDEDTVERARRPFPHEPIRALDALHLASALDARSAVADVALLSLDQRVRSNGERLGFQVVPP
jgi:uncharacterized protein with PIN domain